MTTRERLETAVIAAMESAADAPMVWGNDDCALFAANVVRDGLGYDPAAPWRTGYRTRRGAMRALGKLDLLGALRKAARKHHWKRIHPALAQSGDPGMAWVSFLGKPTLATVICRKRGWFAARDEHGVTLIRADDVAIAWSVLPDALELHAPHASLPSLRRGMVPTSAANHEPISIGVAVLGFFGATASTFVAGAVGYAVLAAGSIALSIGVSMVSSLLSPATGASLSSSGDTGALGNIADTSPLQGAQVTERQAIPYKRVIVGTAYVGGALFFEQVKPPYLTMGVLINYGQISGIDKVFIGTNQLVFSAFAPNTILSPLGSVGQPDYPNRLRVCFRYGSDSQAVDPLILDKYPNVGSEFRQRGIATGVYEYHFGGTDNSAATQAAFVALWGNVSRPTAYTIARGVPCYDPRDATQSMSDATTWKWTNNATLVQTWYLTQPFGGKIPMANIRWDKTILSANYDDDLIGCLDGTMIRRHTIDGVITLSQQPYNVMQDLLTANRAMLLESGGSVWIESSRPKTPVATIYDRILSRGITYQGAKQKTDKVNRLQVRFVAPDQDYQIVDGPILDRADLQATDGEVLTATLALNYTLDYRRAERLQKAFLLSSRLGGTLTCSVSLDLMAKAALNVGEELIGNVVTVSSDLFSKANGNYIILSVGFSDDCTTLSLAMARYDATIEANWNPETDETVFTLAAINTG